MTKFSANLGFLWNDLPLAEAINKAAAAGFDAVECHWPFDYPITEVKQALKANNLTMLGLNTVRGKPGENGLAALPGRESEARAAIKQAFEYAAGIGALNVHVMAGFSEGEDAENVFVENLIFASELGTSLGVGILIEPLNRFDAPGYFLSTTEKALHILERVGKNNVRLMFDCYHVGRTEGEVISRLHACLPVIGHIQIASVPARQEPDTGDLDYTLIYQALQELGWEKPLGAEYRPATTVEEGLGWLRDARADRS